MFILIGILCEPESSGKHDRKRVQWSFIWEFIKDWTPRDVTAPKVCKYIHIYDQCNGKELKCPLVFEVSSLKCVCDNIFVYDFIKLKFNKTEVDVGIIFLNQYWINIDMQTFHWFLLPKLWYVWSPQNKQKKIFFKPSL